jgi:hypothetical protein
MYEVECVLGAGYVCQGWTLGNMYDASEEDTKQEEKIAASEAYACPAFIYCTPDP